MKRIAGFGALDAIAVAVAIFVGWVGLYAGPVQIGAVIDGLGLNPGKSGLLATFELGCVAITSIVLAPKINQLSFRRLAIYGALLASAGQFLSAFMPSFILLAAMRIAVGIGCGCVYAAAVSASAAARDPDRLYAWGTFLSNILFTALLFVLPLSTAFGYHKGVYLSLGVLTIGMLWFLRHLPERGGQGEIEENDLARGIKLSKPIKIAMFVGFFIINMGMGSVWPYVERIGGDIGIGSDSIGWMLSMATISMMVGAGVAGFLGARAGRSLPMTVGFLGSAAACFLLVHPGGETQFLLSLLMWGLFYLFVYPYFIGTPAAMDSSGKLAAAVGGMCVLSYSLGATLGGVVAEQFGYSAVGWIGVVCCLSSLLLVMPVCRALDRQPSKTIPEMPLSSV